MLKLPKELIYLLFRNIYTRKDIKSNTRGKKMKQRHGKSEVITSLGEIRKMGKKRK